MNHEQHPWSEQLDACRPTADDWRLAELADLARAIQVDPQVERQLQRSRDWDRVVGEVVRDVPVPVGLEERLLSALMSRSRSNETVAIAGAPPLAEEKTSVSVAGATIPTPRSAFPASRSARRWALGVGISLACAASLLVAIGLFPQPAGWASQQDAVVHFQRWLPQLSATGWRRAQFPARKLPLSVDPYGWQPLAGTWDTEPAECYDLAPPGPRAYLFVCQASSPVVLPGQVPVTAANTNNGWSVGAWKDKSGAVYLLAVEGSGVVYRRYAKPSTKLATLGPPRRGLLTGASFPSGT